MDIRQNDPGDLRVLIVEDESLIAMLMEDALSDLNCTVVATASSLGEALDKAASMDFDVAILDMNLNGAQACPVAELLVRRQIPFMFVTGYGAPGVPDRFRGIPVLSKPFNERDVGRALEAALKAHASVEPTGTSPARE
ncbi:MAG TPA: response regulator [Rhizomicrobium sp.]|nr:response regulator [Rhizomicrobium sp.]